MRTDVVNRKAFCQGVGVGAAAAVAGCSPAPPGPMAVSELPEPPEDLPVGFVSTREFTKSDVPGRLRKIDWFSRCGTPFEIALSMPVTRVSSWPDAAASLAGDVWSIVELQAQNQLSAWLDRNDREHFQRWNDLVRGFNEAILMPLQRAHWEPYQTAHGLDKIFVDSVRWDIRGALMENAYLGNGHRCCFFQELLCVYEAGHFPCGWIGEWPQGQLIVY